MLAKIDAQRTQAEENRAQTQRIQTLLPEEVKSTRALTESRLAETRREDELLQYRKNQINANITQSLAAAGASQSAAATGAVERELLNKKIGEYVTLERGGQKYTARGIELDKEIADLQRTIISKNLEHNKRLQDIEKDERTRIKYASDAEANIRANAPGGIVSPNKNNAGLLAPDVEMYHASSGNPYVYVIEPDPGGFNTWENTSSSKAVKRDLPKVDGHQYTAREIYKSAQARSMTVQDYLEQVFYPMLEQPVPWHIRKDLR